MKNQKSKTEEPRCTGSTGYSCSLPDPNFIVSLSGGKDSTAMLHWMLERGEKIHSVVFFDTGWEFPAMAAHIDLVEQKTGIKIIRLKPKMSFDTWMFDKKIIANKGQMKGRLHRIGCGWPNPRRRWCTGKKIETITPYINSVESSVCCIGIAVDEQHRTKHERYPLIEYGKTEADCLKYCKDLGYHWDGLYDLFSRVSCYCCPLQKMNDLRKLRKHYPDLWEKMLDMDMRQPRTNEGFRGDKTLIDLECRFTQEDKQGNLWAD